MNTCGSCPPRPAYGGGFSLGEVVLALAVLAIAVVSMLGIIGPTLNAVKQAQDTNAATGCIAKMNAILDAAPFYSSTAPFESAYMWVYYSNKGNNGAPTLFIFYNALPQTPSAGQTVTPEQYIVRYNPSTTGLNTQLSSVTTKTFTPISDLLQAILDNRVRGPVIAMTVSISPLVLNFPTRPADETKWYQSPQSGSLFPSVGAIPSDPDSYNANTGLTAYPEGYLPILVQAFLVSLDGVDSTTSPAAYGVQLVSQLNANTRLFTYTTAKLR